MLTDLFTLGRDAELRYTQSGTAVCSLALAYNYGQKDQATGNQPTQWIDAALWGKQAEALAQYLVKGTRLMVSLNDIHIETYPKNDGTQGFKLVGNVVQGSLKFASRKSDNQQQQAQQPAPQTPVQQSPAPQNQFANEFEDDIPFSYIPA